MPSFLFNFVRSLCRIPLLVNTLIGLFQKFIVRSNSLVCSDVLMQNKFVYERIIDTLSRFVIRANPTKEHIRSLIIKAAKMELISKPSPAFRSFKDFRNFFKSFTGNHISSISKLSKPTDTKVLQYKSIGNSPVPSDKHEENTFDYLNRYINESDKKTLEAFLRFCMDLLSLYQILKLWWHLRIWVKSKLVQYQSINENVYYSAQYVFFSCI